MMEILARNWGWVLLRGIVALLFGVFTLLNPAIALMTLVLLFGTYALLDGAFMIVWAIVNRRGRPRWVALLVGGLLSIVIGIQTLVTPNITAVALLAIIATWSIIVGIAELVAAIKLRKMLTGEWMLMLAALASAAFGVFLFARPGLGALAVVLWIGAYAIFSGILLVVFAFRLRSWGRSPASAAPRAQRGGVPA
jgi:uncharacterized membrane protein HdeD (DUF308 family)